MFTFGDLCLVSVPYNETSGFVFVLLYPGSSDDCRLISVIPWTSVSKVRHDLAS